MYDIENYYRARSVQHACELLSEYPQARLLAGGTDVLIQLHHLNPNYRHIVDVHDLPELKGIAIDRHHHLRIGSATTFTELIEHPLIQQHLPLLAEAAATIAGPQVRNVATYGGNICNGATSADSASPTLALKAELEIATAHGVIGALLRVFTRVPEKLHSSKGKSWWPSILLPSITNILAAATLNTPCVAQWISPQLAVRRHVASLKGASPISVSPMALLHQRQFAARTPNKAQWVNR